jgi:hypothetical protein
VQRLRLYDLRTSSLPGILGLCVADVTTLADYVNRAQERLLNAKEAGDEGWYGTWAEMAFVVQTPNPPQACLTSANLTPPRQVARIEYMNICDRPVPVNNQFFEYLQFGNGRMPKHFTRCQHLTQGYSRNNVVTFLDMTNPPQFIRVYFTDPADIAKRVLIQGLDANSSTIYTQDGLNQVTGIFLPLASPFVQTPMTISQITGIQKDITQGQVQFFQVDPTTGAQVMIHTMEPSEQTAWYRRYLINPLPLNCCFGPTSSPCAVGPPPSTPQLTSNTINLTFLAKLDLIPVVTDTDYTIITSREAIIQECQSIRYDAMDTEGAKQMAAQHHLNAIRILNGQLTNYLGLDSPAVSFKPFGSASLRRQRVGSLI